MQVGAAGGWRLAWNSASDIARNNADDAVAAFGTILICEAPHLNIEMLE